MPKTTKINDRAIECPNGHLDPIDRLMGAMIELSLYDATREYPPITKKKTLTLWWLLNNYTRTIMEIDKNKADALYFINSEKSLLNKYYNMPKDYLLRRYKEKYHVRETHYR